MGSPEVLRVEPTPNPNSAKFVLDRQIPGGQMKSYMKPADASGDPLGEALFAIEGVESVFMMANFITVNKSPSTEWAVLVQPLEEAIRTHF